MTNEEMLAQLLERNSELFTTYGVWATAQIKLLAGTIDDPDSYNAAGGKTGALGYYPVENVSGQTIYVPSLARLQTMAAGGGDLSAIEAVLSATVQAKDVAKQYADGLAASTAKIDSALQPGVPISVTTETLNSKIMTGAERRAVGVLGGSLRDFQGALLGIPLITLGRRTALGVHKSSFEPQWMGGVWPTPSSGPIRDTVKAVREYVGASTSRPLLSVGRRVALSFNTRNFEPMWMGAQWPVPSTGPVRDAAGAFRRYTGSGNIPLVAVNRREVISIDPVTFTPLWMGKAWPGATAAALPYAIGRGSLGQLHAKLATIKVAGTGKAKVMYFGDSYTELLPIPQQFAGIMRPIYGDAGGGWISAQASSVPLDGATFTISSGWTSFDAGTGSAILPLPSVGVSHDGKALYTTATDQTARWAFSGTEFRLIYARVSGAFRYRIDGGAWTTVTGDGSGVRGILKVLGLSAGSHIVEVDTTVNTGTVVLFGLYFTNTAGVGVEILKCGNGSLHAGHLATYVNTYVADMVADIAPDVIIVILGTNDYASNNSSPALMVATYTALVSAIRAALPNVGFIFVSPERTNLTPQSGTLAEYRDAVYAFCRDNGHAWYNMHDQWSTWAVENDRGMFSGDIRHVNNAGAYRLGAGMRREFFDL